MSEYKKFTKDVIIVGLTSLLIRLRGLITLPILSKNLVTSDYGAWVQIIVTVSLLTPVITLGLPFALVRFLAAEKNKQKIQECIYSVLSVIFIVGLVIAAICVAFSGQISAFFGNIGTLPIKIMAIVILVECMNRVLINTFRAFGEIKRYSFLALSQTFGEILLIAIAILLGYKLLGAVVSLLIIRFIVFFVMAGLIIKKVGIKLPNFLKIKEYLSFSVPTIAGNISNWIVRSSDRYLIGGFLGIAFVAYYSPAYRLSDVITMFIAPLSFVLPVFLAKFFDENKLEQVKVYLKYSFKYFLILAIPTAFGLSTMSKQVLEVLSTQEIASHGYFITPFVLASLVLFGGKAITSQILMLVKRTKLNAMIWLSAAVINLGLNFIFIPRFGILGAAITTLIAYAITLILSFYFSFKYIKFHIDWQSILKSLFASSLMLLFILKFNPIGIKNIIFAIIAGAAIYISVLFILRTFKREETKFLKSLFKINRAT